MKKIFFCLIFVSINFAVLAQDELPPIQLDRPDLTESPFLTPEKYIQVESGSNYQKIDEANQLTIPTILTKYGINETFELRLITTLQSFRMRNGSSSQTGLIPVWVGFKSKLMKEEGFLPEMAFIGHLAMNKMASSDFQTSNIAPQFRFVMQNTLSDKVSLGYNLGMEWNGNSPVGSFIYTVTSGISLTKKLGCFLEFYGNKSSQTSFNHNFDGGFTYLLNNNSMLDTSAGLLLWDGSLNVANSFFISCGYSFRFNTIDNSQFKQVGTSK